MRGGRPLLTGGKFEARGAPLLAAAFLLCPVAAEAICGEAGAQELVSDCEAGARRGPVDGQGRFGFMVDFAEPGIMARMERAPGERFDSNSPRAVAARAEVRAEQAAHFEAIAEALGRVPVAGHRYQITHSGISTRMTPEEAQTVLRLPGVTSVRYDCSYPLAVETTGGVGPDPEPSSRWGTHDRVRNSGKGTTLSVVDVRTGRHDGFSRIVIELDGQGNEPGFAARYVPAAIKDPSGIRVDIAGEAVLEVVVSGWGYPHDVGIDDFSGPWPVSGPASGSVTEVLPGGFFEGLAQFFIGVRGGVKPYTATTTQGPPRIVIDMADRADMRLDDHRRDGRARETPQTISSEVRYPYMQRCP